MRVIAGLITLLAAGGLAVAVVAWLASRRLLAARMAGLVLASSLALYCALVVFALIADNGVEARLRIGGLASILSFIVIGTAAVLVARRSVRGT